MHHRRNVTANNISSNPVAIVSRGSVNNSGRPFEVGGFRERALQNPSPRTGLVELHFA